MTMMTTSPPYLTTTLASKAAYSTASFVTAGVAGRGGRLASRVLCYGGSSAELKAEEGRHEIGFQCFALGGAQLTAGRWTLPGALLLGVGSVLMPSRGSSSSFSFASAARASPPQLWSAAYVSTGSSHGGNSSSKKSEDRWLLWRDAQLVMEQTISTPSSSAGSSLVSCTWWRSGKTSTIGAIAMFPSQVSLMTCRTSGTSRFQQTQVCSCTLQGGPAALLASPPSTSPDANGRLPIAVVYMAGSHSLCVLCVTDVDVDDDEGRQQHSSPAAPHLHYFPPLQVKAKAEQLLWLSPTQIAVRFSTGAVEVCSTPLVGHATSPSVVVCQLPVAAEHVHIACGTQPNALMYAALHTTASRSEDSLNIIRYGMITLPNDATAGGSLPLVTESCCRLLSAATSLAALSVGGDQRLYVLVRGLSSASSSAAAAAGGGALSLISLRRPEVSSSPVFGLAHLTHHHHHHHLQWESAAAAASIELRERSEASLAQLSPGGGEKGVLEALAVLNSIQEAAMTLEALEQQQQSTPLPQHSYARRLFGQCCQRRSEAEAFQLLYCCAVRGGAEGCSDNEARRRLAVLQDSVIDTPLQTLLDRCAMVVSHPSTTGGWRGMNYCTAALLAAVLPGTTLEKATVGSVLAATPAAALQHHLFQRETLGMRCVALSAEAGLLILTLIFLSVVAVEQILMPPPPFGGDAEHTAKQVASQRATGIWIDLQIGTTSPSASALRTWLSAYQLPLVSAHTGFLCAAADLSLSPSHFVASSSDDGWLRVSPLLSLHAVPVKLQHRLLSRLLQLHWLGTELGSVLYALQTTLRLPPSNPDTKPAIMDMEQQVFHRIAAPGLAHVPRGGDGGGGEEGATPTSTPATRTTSSAFSIPTFRLIEETTFFFFSCFSRFQSTSSSSSLGGDGSASTLLRQQALEVYRQLTPSHSLPHFTALLSPAVQTTAGGGLGTSSFLSSQPPSPLWTWQFLLCTRQYERAREWCEGKRIEGWGGEGVMRVAIAALEKLMPAAFTEEKRRGRRRKGGVLISNSSSPSSCKEMERKKKQKRSSALLCLANCCPASHEREVALSAATTTTTTTSSSSSSSAPPPPPPAGSSELHHTPGLFLFSDGNASSPLSTSTSSAVPLVRVSDRCVLQPSSLLSL